MSPSNFTAANVAAAVGFAAYAFGCWRFSVETLRRAGRDYPRAFAGACLAGFLLMEAGVIQSQAAGPPLGPPGPNLRLTCQAEPHPDHYAQDTITFRFDAARQCQNITFYRMEGRSLQRVVLSDYPSRKLGHVYQASRLQLDLDAADPTHKATFTRSDLALTQADYQSLVQLVAGAPIACPAARTANALASADAHAGQLAAKLATLTPLSSTVTRWDCQADP